MQILDACGRKNVRRLSCGVSRNHSSSRICIGGNQLDDSLVVFFCDARNLLKMEPDGIEPTASWVQTKCSTQRELRPHLKMVMLFVVGLQGEKERARGGAHSFPYNSKFSAISRRWSTPSESSSNCASYATFSFGPNSGPGFSPAAMRCLPISFGLMGSPWHPNSSK